MTVEQINRARAWLASHMEFANGEIIDTIEEALEIAMEQVLKKEFGK